MRAAIVEACGCFPTGRHYAGIAHLLRTVARGLASEFAQDAAWQEIPIALVDLETTGRDASVDRVIEIGVVIAQNGEILRRHNWLVQPGVPIPEEVRALTGIGDDDVKDAPRFEVVALEIAEALSGCVPAAYNAAFDRAFLHNELARAAGLGVVLPTANVPAMRRDVEWIDPLVWAREIQRDERSRALGEVAARLGIKLENAHRASDDAEAALRVLLELARDGRVPRVYGAFVSEQRRYALLHADERRMWRAPQFTGGSGGATSRPS